MRKLHRGAMRPLALLVPIAFSTIAYPVFACSPLPGWKPPTPQSAYLNADVVVHVRVLSQEQAGESIARVQPIRVLKGEFTSQTVYTGADAACGIGSFREDAEYVFFFKGDGYFVNHLVQPWNVTTEQILEALSEE
jgi:hypothetical protein